MKLVINISEYDKEWIQNAYGIPHEINLDIARAIINGEPYKPQRPKGYMKIKVISAVDGEDLFCENCDAYCLSPSYKFCPKCGVEFIGVRGEQDDNRRV